jgi:hypothetical protein
MGAPELEAFFSPLTMGGNVAACLARLYPADYCLGEFVSAALESMIVLDRCYPDTLCICFRKRSIEGKNVMLHGCALIVPTKKPGCRVALPINFT